MTVIEAQSMTVAAQRLGMTQSAVSQTINSLEQKLGATLIDRSVRPLSMTMAGRVLYEKTLQILDNARTIPQSVRDADRRSIPHLRLGLVDSFSETVGTHLLRAHVDIAWGWSLWSGLSMMHEDALRSRAVDIIVTASEMGVSEDFERHKIMSEPFIIAVPRKANWSASSVVDLASAHPMIRFSSRSIIGQQIEQYIRRRRIDAPHRFEFDSSKDLIAMVAAGMGWALLTPLCMLQAMNYIEGVQLLPLSQPGLRRRLTMINRHNELGQAPQKLYESSISILRDDCMPKIFSHAPWVAEQITFGEE